METVVIKIGGALITDKSKPFSIRYNILNRLAHEISRAYKECCSRVLVVHGGGSFGHYVVAEHGSVNTVEAIVQTAWFMKELNMIVVDALMLYGVPAVSFDIHAITVVQGEGIYLYLEPISRALELGLVPVLYGDIAIGDKVRVISGDEVAWYLSSYFSPSKLLFATAVDGVYDRNPSDPKAKLLDTVTLNDIHNILFSESQGIDVTGGMKLKLELALKYASNGINDVVIFNGLKEGQTYSAICGRLTRCTRVLLYEY
ncbi:MAG: isopentenyl phosphate kinase [Ignisphaera sp.]|uniref:Isopentenyl phosphate kinase n=1 Tax=Ignisphaera aggregans TaxID=334771 RepID=A0A7C4JIJ9_9CREN